MVMESYKFTLITVIVLVFISRFDYVRTLDGSEKLTENVVNAVVPDTLALEVQGHENTSGRKVRQFGFPFPPPPPRPPLPFGFGYRPFASGPAFSRPVVAGGGFAAGGFQRTRVVTRTQTRVVDRYRGGGFRGGFYG